MNKKYKVPILILVYYTTSLSLGFFTTFFLSKNAYNFRFPLFKSSLQNLVHFFITTIILKINKEEIKGDRFLYTTIPCAITGAIDIGLSSFSLRTVTLAFYTMVKSSAPVFILLSGFAFGIEKPSIMFFLIIFTIGAGVFMTSMKNTSFDPKGFTLISAASFMAGFRWAFIQYLLEKRKVINGGLHSTIRDLCLPISCILFIMSSQVEGIYEILNSEFFNNSRSACINLGLITLSGILSFTLVYSEFLLVSETSVVFLSVSSIVKELVIIIVSLYRKEIQLSLLNYSGLLISIIGILCYNLKRRKRPEIIEIEE
ncbi:integral membrane protein [Nosema bombycis CQ1]|jgi:solute carrier family 35 protein C2|uniref:Integral membrane protein n=1 Tax=Nosema bombycis (strain CQ1 / CVCC 102059) TaxID=578461 RepID=R0KPA9_NOSB1|nr:integral membrane protein [Nosema bombycis CQ1]|eukprot:EOB12536.1 integral membrane protein [Nosema bombycis CQ1]